MAKGMRVDGARIGQARTALPGRVTQAQFAERLGIHWVTQSRIENGKANVSLELLTRIAKATGKPVEHFLVEEAGNPDPFHEAA